MNQQAQTTPQGEAAMSDVTTRTTIERLVIARGEVQMQSATLQAIHDGQIPKGDVLATARIAGILAAKQTAHLIPSAISRS